jgi:hypothetical protein
MVVLKPYVKNMKQSKTTVREYITCPFCKGTGKISMQLKADKSLPKKKLIYNCPYCIGGLAIIEVEIQTSP